MNLTKITITALSLLTLSFSSSVFANVDKEMEKCAMAALEKINLTTKSVVVNNSPKDLHEMDHNPSTYSTEYRMNVASPKSGIELGEVACTIDEAGEIVSSSFLAKT